MQASPHHLKPITFGLGLRIPPSGSGDLPFSSLLVPVIALDLPAGRSFRVHFPGTPGSLLSQPQPPLPWSFTGLSPLPVDSKDYAFFVWVSFQASMCRLSELTFESRLTQKAMESSYLGLLFSAGLLLQMRQTACQRNLFSHGTGGWKDRIQVASTRMVSPEPSLPGLQTLPSYCSHEALSAFLLSLPFLLKAPVILGGAPPSQPCLQIQHMVRTSIGL